MKQIFSMSGKSQAQRHGPLSGERPSASILMPPPLLPPSVAARCALAVPATAAAFASSSVSFIPVPSSGQTSPRGPRAEGEELDVADDTILDMPPARSPRLSPVQRERSPSRNVSEPVQVLRSNLNDPQVELLRRHRSRSNTKGSLESDEHMTHEDDWRRANRSGRSYR